MVCFESHELLRVTRTVTRTDEIRGIFPQIPMGAIAMTIHHNSADLSAPWRAAAAYLYTLDLDGPALAWEYLRRHTGYQAHWHSGQHRASARRWGLQSSRRPAARRAPGTPALDPSG
jgi:Family of unknown function (DUF6499)